MATAVEILGSQPPLRSLYYLRSDLRGPGIDPSEAEAEYFLLWAAVFGKAEYQNITIDTRFYEFLTKPVGAYFSRLQMFVANLLARCGDETLLNIDNFHAWYYQTAIERYGLAIFLTAQERVVCSAYRTPNISSPRSDASRQKAARTKSAVKRIREARVKAIAGVNVIGYFDGILGIGEDARAVVNSLLHAGIPTSIYNVALSASDATSLKSGLAELYVDRPVFPINLFCTTAFDCERLRMEKGQNLFHGRYNIGYWPWELPNFPSYWAHAFDAIQEVWAISSYVQGVYERRTRKPVIYMPPYVNVSSLERYDLAQLGIEAGSFVFLSVFDFNSHVARKNPIGAIDAFKRAFENRSKNERLVIKTINGHLYPERLNSIVEYIQGDPRILVVDGALTRAESCGLIASADCLISLHRAEGFGRVIAEAMFLGTPVVATNWSGSSDYLTEQTGFPVDQMQRPLSAGEYVYTDGSTWAEPSIDDAARQLYVVRTQKQKTKTIISTAKTKIQTDHGLEATAQSLLKRLGLLTQKHAL